MQSPLVAALKRRAQRHRRPLLGGVAAIAVTAALAAALPVEVAAGAATAARNPLAAPPPPLAGEESLTAFLASRRWGVSLAEADAARAADRAAQLEQAAGAAALRRIGFVGVSGAARVGADGVSEWSERVVLLALPDGGIARLAAGDSLPDGRRLVAIAANALTLATAGREETLRLFPAADAGTPPPPESGGRS